MDQSLAFGQLSSFAGKTANFFLKVTGLEPDAGLWPAKQFCRAKLRDSLRSLAFGQLSSFAGQNCEIP
jgi:hypothetical protein